MTARNVSDVNLDCVSRRGVLRSLGAVGVTTIAAGVLVACSTPNSRPTDTADADEGAAAGGASEGTEGEGDGDAVAEASVSLAEVPVGEARVVEALGTRFVVAQPSAGEVVAFSASCTHAGTLVEAVGGLELRCPNHGSRFDAGDGAAVLNGPAADPLPPVQARVEGDQVLLSV